MNPEKKLHFTVYPLESWKQCTQSASTYCIQENINRNNNFPMMTQNL